MGGKLVIRQIFYFIRKYERFSPTTLIGTLTAIVGGDVIASTFFLIAEK